MEKRVAWNKGRIIGQKAPCSGRLQLAHLPYAERQKIELKLLISPEVEDNELVVDEHRLLQILANLLSNAVKFSPQDGSVVLFAYLQADAVEITVEDEGPGIPPDVQHRIFQRFSQADASSSKMKGGTGLGLALCKELVEAMNWSIGFISIPGRGAKFFVRLPFFKSV